jgi:uncharacterized protein (TIGR03435 family)
MSRAIPTADEGARRRYRRRQACVITAALTGAAMFAQSTPRPASFDVATIRSNRSGANGSSIDRSGGRMTIRNTSLRECVAFAYDIATGRDYELLGPGWLDAEKFDITATFSPETSRDRVREMLRTLLAERFKLKIHSEARMVESYVL